MKFWNPQRQISSLGSPIFSKVIEAIRLEVLPSNHHLVTTSLTCPGGVCSTFVAAFLSLIRYFSAIQERVNQSFHAYPSSTASSSAQYMEYCGFILDGSKHRNVHVRSLLAMCCCSLLQPILLSCTAFRISRSILSHVSPASPHKIKTLNIGSQLCHNNPGNANPTNTPIIAGQCSGRS